MINEILVPRDNANDEESCIGKDSVAYIEKK